MMIENTLKDRMEQERKELEIESEIAKEFKVFKDPTFNEFIQIVGADFNEELPLFAQLYILKEIL